MLSGKIVRKVLFISAALMLNLCMTPTPTDASLLSSSSLSTSSLSSSSSALLQIPVSSQCQTLSTTVTISKEVKTPDGELLHVCEGVIRLNKCEGGCVSNLRPSINTITGLFKECICCREGRMERREVEIDICHDTSGNRLPGQTAVVTIEHPADCGCHRCS